MTEKDYWELAVSFHGHKCPGLAIGFRGALLARELLDIVDENGDEDIVCLAETDACGIDAFQAILKTTLGSGSLRIIYKGKNAFSVYNRKNGKSARLVWKDGIKARSKDVKTQIILNADPKDLFHIKEVKEAFPERAQIHGSAVCFTCGEVTAENALRETGGKYYCTDCRENT